MFMMTLTSDLVSMEGAAEDPVPVGVHAVIELFTGPLAKVAFPDVDAATLRRQADEVRGEARAVGRAREALEAALAALAARQAALAGTAARAVAYARIYSDAHPERAALAAAIAELTSVAAPREPAPVAGPPAKRRGRPPKRSAELFDAPSVGSDA
jgi:ABC-type transporter Mla subunit MlaD